VTEAQPLAYRFLEEPAAAATHLAALRGAPVVAFDLEADSLHRYREKICLVQLSTPSANLILDPLACREALLALGPLFADPAVTKIVHGGDYDVRLLKKDLGLEVRNLFDTMIAAQFTGREQFGLAALLLELFGIALDKRYQRADWSLRPLGPELLAYAALDTAHLFALKARLEEELERLGRRSWVEEECRLLEAVEPGAPKKPWCLDVKGASRFTPRQLAVLQGLLELRDELARELDRPPFKVLSNQTLLDWAQNPPTSHRALLVSPGTNRTLLSRKGDALLEAMTRALVLPEGECPRRVATRGAPLTEAQARRFQALRKVREGAAARLKLSPGLLVNSATLEKLAREEPLEAAETLRGVLKGWQLSTIGEEVRATLRAAGGAAPPA
jgi:ribonuclease D